MNVWIMSANPQVYDHDKAFHDQGFVIWKQTRKFEVGDIIYIYCTKPIAKVRFKTIVDAINLAPRKDDYWQVKVDDNKLGKRAMKLVLLEINDSDGLSYEILKDKGMKYPPQSPGKINNELRSYLEGFFEEKR